MAGTNDGCNSKKYKFTASFSENSSKHYGDPCTFAFANAGRYGKNGLKSSTCLATAALAAVFASALEIRPAQAQATVLPVGCSILGTTVNCVAPPTPIGGVSVNEAGATVNIGNADTPTVIDNPAGTGVVQSGPGQQTLNLLNAGSSITGAGDGVFINSFPGATGAKGNVVQQDNWGNVAPVISVDGGVLVNAEGSITGGKTGIRARNSSTGSLELNVSDVTGVNGDGINAVNSASDIRVQTVPVFMVPPPPPNTPPPSNIVPPLPTSGAASTDRNSQIRPSNLSASYDGPLGMPTDLIINSDGTVTGGQNGIFALNSGSGKLEINVVDVEGKDGDGIHARNSVENFLFSQQVTVTSGNGLSDGFVPVDAIAGVAPTDLIINATGTVIGSNDGIDAFNSGSGKLEINVVNVEGVKGDGIEATNAINFGKTVFGTVNTNNEKQAGIANGPPPGETIVPTDLIINATGTVTGGDDGIDAFNEGTGRLEINAVDVTGRMGDGIYAENSSFISDGFFLGPGIGAGLGNAPADGRGAPSLVVVPTDLLINTTGQVTGYWDGIAAFNDGSGLTKIDTVGVTGINGYGIVVDNSGTDLLINSKGLVKGYMDGISALNFGTGMLEINATDVTSEKGTGITAINSPSQRPVFVEGSQVPVASVTDHAPIEFEEVIPTDLLITTTGTVSGYLDGIDARNVGSGKLDIDAFDVIGMMGNGISAGNGGTDLNITTRGTVSGKQDGILALNFGSGQTVIQANNVTGSEQDGIYALNLGFNPFFVEEQKTVEGQKALDGQTPTMPPPPTDLLITTTGTVTGADDGIEAINSGSGELSITAANVEGKTGNGIDALNSPFTPELLDDFSLTNDGNGDDNDEVPELPLPGDDFVPVVPTDLSVTTTGTVSGQVNGIKAVNRGTGSVSVTTFGSVSGKSGSGILVENDGMGPITIDAFGAVSGNTGIMVGARMNSVPTTINTSSSITGHDGTAINLQGDGNDVVNILAGSQINGTVDFGNGNDNLGGTNPADIDTLTFEAGINSIVNFADAGGTGQGDTDLQSAPEVIIFGGNGVVTNGGLTAIAFNQGGIGVQGNFVGDLSDSIFNLVDRQGHGPFENQPNNQQGFGAIHDGEEGDHGMRIWGSFFGGGSEIGSLGGGDEIQHSFGGFLGGIETGHADDLGTFGILGGIARSRVSETAELSVTDIDSFFGGVYWNKDYGTHRINAAFVAGGTDNELRRFVGGLPSTGEFDGTFYVPSITVSAPIDILPTPLIISGRASYLELDLDGFTETGALLPITFGDRDISVVNLRGQFILPQVLEGGDGSHTHIDVAVGVDSTIDAGFDDVSAVIAGTPFSFSAETVEQTAAFVGLNFTHTSGDGRKSLTLSGEAQSDFNGGVQATGEVRITYDF